MSLPEYQTVATLKRLQNQKPRIHSVIKPSKVAGLAHIILNENTVPNPNSSDYKIQLEALSLLQELLVLNQIDRPSSIYLINQNATLHGVSQIAPSLISKICADPENPRYLTNRMLARVYCTRYPELKNFLSYIPGLLNDNNPDPKKNTGSRVVI